MTSITIQSVRDCAAGKKYGSLMAADGNKYLFAGGMNGVFLQGQTVDVPTRTENWRDGPVTIISGRPSSAGSGVVAQQPPAQQQAPAPRTSTSYDDHKDAQIFVTAIVGRAMGSGKFDTQDVKLIALAAVEAWNEVKGKL